MKKHDVITTVDISNQEQFSSQKYVRYVLPLYESYLRSRTAVLSAVLLDDSGHALARERFYIYGIKCLPFSRFQLHLFCSKHPLGKKVILSYNSTLIIPKPSYVISMRAADWWGACEQIGVVLYDLISLSYDGSRYFSYHDAGLFK